MTETPATPPPPPSPGTAHLEPVLRIERTFSARRERVYAAWTEGALLREWSCPESLTVAQAWTDPRVGGRFLIEMVEPDGKTRHLATGRYLELDPPSRLRMTHGWLHEGEGPEDVDARATRVTVELFDEGPRTRRVFVQRGFLSMESRDGHDEGWKSSFRQLEALLAREEGDG